MSDMAQMFDFERPYEKEENRFNLGAINAQTLRSEWTILLYILDCKYEEEKEISFCSFLFFGNQNRNFETETDLECHLSIGQRGWHQDNDNDDSREQ